MVLASLGLQLRRFRVQCRAVGLAGSFIKVGFQKELSFWDLIRLREGFEDLTAVLFELLLVLGALPGLEDEESDLWVVRCRGLRP